MRCTDCGRLLAARLESEALRCPEHGLAMALINRQGLWNGELVAILRPTQAGNGRYVVQFATGKRRTVRAAHLRRVTMRVPGVAAG